MNKFRYTIIFILLCLSLMLVSCKKELDEETSSSINKKKTEEVASVESSGKKTEQESGDSGEDKAGTEAPEDQTAEGTEEMPAFRAEDFGTPCGTLAENLDLSEYSIASLYGCRYSNEFRGKDAEQLKGILENLTCVEAKELHIYEDLQGWQLQFTIDYDALQKEYESQLEGIDTDNMEYEELEELLSTEEIQKLRDKIQQYPPITFTMALTTAGYCVIGSSDICCVLTPELQDYLGQFRSIQTTDTKEFYFSTAYPEEPCTEEECRDAAVYCVTEWLTECGKPDTDPEYRNKKFIIAPENKNNFLAGGYLDGRKEFLVEVCFTAEYDDEATFYSRNEIAHYTEAGTFWEGVYLRARFCWEDGVISLLAPNGSNKYLNGFQTNDYRNFFDYARRSGLEQEIEDSFVPYLGVVVSKNLTVTENGKELNLDIYQMGDVDVRKDTVYGDPDFRTYRGDEKFYSTGVYFTDGGTSTKYIEYPKDFRLTFDNYTNDGNPDFAVLYDSDENGSYYTIKSIQSDGRVFTESGRAYEGGVYVAGCFEPSPRLQRTENYLYIGWQIDQNGNPYPTVGSETRITLPDINMYSDRLYLPGTLKLYLPEESTVTCFLWNNTTSNITTQKEYRIERFEDGDWVLVGQGENKDNIFRILPKEYAELTYDLSAIADRREGRYRIVQGAGEGTGYGEFWLAAGDGADTRSEALEIEVVSGTLPEGCLSGMLRIRNNGLQPRRIPAIKLQRENGQDVPIALDIFSSEKFLDSLEKETITFYCEKGLTAGKYRITLGDTAIPIEVLSNPEYPKLLEIQAVWEDQTVSLALKNLGTEEISLYDIALYQLAENSYQPTPLMPTESLDCIASGDTVRITMENYTKQFLTDDMMQELYSLWQEQREEYSMLWEEYDLPDDADFAEFCSIILARLSLPEDGTFLLSLRYTYGEQKMTSRVKMDFSDNR